MKEEQQEGNSQPSPKQAVLFISCPGCNAVLAAGSKVCLLLSTRPFGEYLMCEGSDCISFTTASLLAYLSAAKIAHPSHTRRAVRRAATSCKGKARRRMQPHLQRKGKRGSEMMAGSRTLSCSNAMKALGMAALMR